MSDAPDRIRAALADAAVLEDGGGGSSHRGGGPAPPEEGDGGAIDLACALEAMTDLGNAMRFRRRHGGRFLYVAEWGWLAWDKRRWNRAEADAMVAMAVHDTIRAIAREAKALKDSRHDVLVDEKKELWRSDKLMAWCTASQGNAHVACIARLAQPYLTAQVSDFDADPMAFNVENGTLHFARREDGDYVRFDPHDPAEKITKLAPVAYDPEAACPVYDTFFAYVQPEEAVRRHLHAFGGVALTGIKLQKLAFWYGRGRNGKTTAEDAWAHVMGDYAAVIPVETFLDQGRARRGGEATPDTAILPGVRYLRTSEPERGAKIAESFVKTATGGAPIKARHLNRDFFDVDPCFKLVVAGNYKPRIEGTDEGIWRRVLLVLWGVTIPEEMVDPDLPAKLRAEAPGILNRLLDGLRDYLDNGLAPPEDVLSATAEFRQESDPLGQWIAACVRDRPGGRVQSSIAHAVFNAWGLANGVKPWSQAGFGRAMRERGYRAKQSNFMFFLDIELIRQVSDFVDHDGNPRTATSAERWFDGDGDPPA